MARIDTLKIYKDALDSGFTEQQALFEVELAKSYEPEVDLKLAFERIDRRFERIDLRFEIIDQKFETFDKIFSTERKYLLGITIAIFAGIFGNLVINYIKG